MSNSPGPSGFSTSANPHAQDQPGFPSRRGERDHASVNDSPTSTIASTPSRMPLRTLPTSSTFAVPKKRVIIRSDPTLVTCFDPADKELYDLWAPKR